MDYKDLKQKNASELQLLLSEERERLRRLSFGAGERQLKNVREIRTTKKTIARIETLITAARATT